MDYQNIFHENLYIDSRPRGLNLHADLSWRVHRIMPFLIDNRLVCKLKFVHCGSVNYVVLFDSGGLTKFENTFYKLQN